MTIYVLTFNGEPITEGNLNDCHKELVHRCGDISAALSFNMGYRIAPKGGES